MGTVLADLRAALADETADFELLLSGCGSREWDLPTPAEGWSVRDQISHLAYFDEAAVLAATDPAHFQREAAELLTRGPDFPDLLVRDSRALPSDEVLRWFRRARHDLLTCLSHVEPDRRLPWYGPAMSPASSITARLMETWAHGQDVADALGVVREPTARLRHIAHLGIRTRAFSHQLRDLPAPSAEVRVELQAPDRSRWTWGPEDAPDRIRGDALDFCLIVTQRRHLDETTLHVVGEDATTWMRIAQAFAGAPGPGRAPLSGR